MKKFLSIIIALFSLNASSQIQNIAEKLGYERDSKLLILHADDIGVSHSVNQASFDSFLNSSINSGSIMVPCPWVKEVADFHKKNPSFDLGLHLTLNAEWKNYKWNGVLPSNEISSLLNEFDEFYDNTSDVNINADPEEVRKELQAQIDHARSIGLNPTHIDTHMGALAVNKEIWRVYIEVGHKNKLVNMVTNSRSLNLFDKDFPIPDYIVPVNNLFMIYPELDREFVQNEFGKKNAEKMLIKKSYNYNNWIEIYSSKIGSLGPGLNVFLIHLGYDNAELQAVTIDHPEYGSLWRQLDYEVFNSSELKNLIKENNIKLVTWGEIREVIYPDLTVN
ncbi:MAG TPA: ChbG/HpnK family deacetylase [Alphaproteobacteria bacterium]|jgi:hypothetical protein|nr:ChbG/HpnK family deacetylase [Alphaproteobacteria bacterium]